MVGLLVTSKRTHANTCFPRPLLLVSLSPWQAPANPYLFRRPSNIHRQIWLSLVRLLLLSPGFCLCPTRVAVFPSLWTFCNQILLSFKVRFPGDSHPFAGSPGWEVYVGPRNFAAVREFLGVIALQFVGRPPSEYRILFLCDCTPPTILLWLLLCP